eukprot:5657629-Prymnesium_polylepis.1
MEDGSPCPRSAQDASDRCFAHGGGRRCVATTEDGSPCPSSARGATDYCSAHGGGRRCACGKAARYSDSDGEPCALCLDCAVAEGAHPARIHGASHQACRFFDALSVASLKKEVVPHVHWDQVSGEWNDFKE